jgi:hypothetical protein
MRGRLRFDSSLAMSADHFRGQASQEQVIDEGVT